MNPVPFRQQPRFRALLFGIALGATWLYAILYQGGWKASLAGIGLDVLLLLLLIQASLFFHAQFLLPARRLNDRLRLWGRLLLHSRNAHGPAIFIQNGRRVERRGEGHKAGPGLLWIDMASAATTRSEGTFKQVLGPGIHFLERQERIDAIFSLHTQTCSVGPSHDEPIFSRLPEDAGEEDRRRFAAMQARRQAVSGLTRDGNEVIPEIRVVFRLDGALPRPGTPGSRFGFSPEAVERAARGSGVNVDAVTARRVTVAWNQLPGLIAVDLWREYLAKFTLDELFSARFAPVPQVLQPETPVQPNGFRARPPVVRRDWPALVLWRVNNLLERRLLPDGSADEPDMGTAPSRRPPAPLRQLPGREYTALEIIAHMVKSRMTQAAVPTLDECGRYLQGHVPSEEYKRLQERGLVVLDVTLNGFRFDPAVEQQIIQQWRTNWHANAMNERVHVEQLEILAAEAGKQKALLEHAGILGRAVQAEAVTSVRAALKVLIHASRNEVLTDERLRGQGAEAVSALAELAKWVEAPGDD